MSGGVQVRSLRRTAKDVVTFIPFIIILIIPLSPVGLCPSLLPFCALVPHRQVQCDGRKPCATHRR